MKLIDAQGEVRLGLFDEPIELVNHRDYDLWTPMGRRAGPVQRHLGFNQFEFLGVLSDELVLGAAIVDVRYVGAAFAYVFDPRTGEGATVSQQLPLGLGAAMVQTPESGASTFWGLGVKLESAALGNARRLHILSRDLTADLTFSEQGTPLRICTRAGACGWTFTRKLAGHRVRGWVRWKGRRIDLDETLPVRGLHDWSAGFMRRETFWNWAACATPLADGRTLGLNLSCGVNETGFSENLLWLDGQRHPLPQVHFAYDRRDRQRPWTITDRAGRVSLSFEPLRCAHQERISVGIVASNFEQLCGRYTGRLETETGEVVALDGAIGFAEWHYARW